MQLNYQCVSGNWHAYGGTLRLCPNTLNLNQSKMYDLQQIRFQFSSFQYQTQSETDIFPNPNEVDDFLDNHTGSSIISGFMKFAL